MNHTDNGASCCTQPTPVETKITTAESPSCCGAPPETPESTDSTDCCGAETGTAPTGETKRRVEIEFLYLDLTVCERCKDTESALEQALTEVSQVLETTGVKVNVNKIHVTSEAEAASQGFLVSPTIRLNGRDIQMNYRESLCESCGTVCNCEGGVSCREWEYQGQWYTSPPKGLVVEAILKNVYGGRGTEPVESPASAETPENLKRFFSGRADRLG
jgi:hypothetical protein